MAPTVGYVILFGLLGITSKFALRQVTWQLGLGALLVVAGLVVLTV